MAGTPIGKIDCQITALSASGNQEAFKNLYDFFEQMVTANYATRIALQYGASGTGTDYHDGANPFGENAFAVYRMDGSTSGNTASDRDGVTLPDFDYYIFFQWADAATFGTSPGNPGRIDGATGDGLGVAMAVRADGGDPWNGTTNNNGTDTKGATVWTAGASTLYVTPLSNGPFGSHLTNKENTRRILDVTTSGARVSMIGTADSVVFLSDVSDDGSFQACYLGVYYPLTGLSPSVPLCAVIPSYTTTLPWADGSGIRWPAADASYTGAAANGGGVLGAFLAEGMTPLSLGQNMPEFGVQPNSEPATAELDDFPVRVIQAGYGDNNGYVGDLEVGLSGVVYNVVTGSTNAALTRAYFGGTTQATIHLSVPWDGTTTPGTTATRAGVTF